MKKLQINIPDLIHKAFKKKCLEQDTTMTEQIIRYIKKIIQQD